VWWYAWLAQTHKPQRVWVVSANTESTLTRAVVAAFTAHAAPGGEVHSVSGSQAADFGTLLRARTLVASVSTFAWWAGFLSQFVTPPPGAAAAAAGAVRLLVPLCGMRHPASLHRVHAYLDLASAPPVPMGWSTGADAGGGDSSSSGGASSSGAAAAGGAGAVPAVSGSSPAAAGNGAGGKASAGLHVTTYELPPTDDWASSEAQQREVLQSAVPVWFASRYPRG
jgi:hypothetical protein